MKIRLVTTSVFWIRILRNHFEYNFTYRIFKVMWPLGTLCQIQKLQKNYLKDG
jgi:hypothetical protein